MTKSTALRLLQEFVNFDFQNRYRNHTDPFTSETITVDETGGMMAVLGDTFSVNFASKVHLKLTGPAWARHKLSS